MMDRNEKKKNANEPADDNPDQKQTASSDQSDLDPFEINFLPQFMEGRGPRDPFVNSQGVVIGDHMYQSKHSPLEQWSTETDPAVMAGDEWVHPFKDIGFHTAENRDIFEEGVPPRSGIFMHPDKDVAYPAYNNEAGGSAGDADPAEASADQTKQNNGPGKP
ncbi:DUF3905 domain-containing protein [Paenibacillus piri]|uniref:DUF3905 domain-containing protein n=1 Tax=Paenibacillus piri TaxID=2547395 RepID=A0A4R5KQI1_9BACL|nr:DUF3905 domain-containing protein [Paenibacillus piri]TDF97228.1 DUF3905 domain-containing protein [Paenibacillus piri]